MSPRRPSRVALSFLAKNKTALASAGFWRTMFVMVPMQVPLLCGAIVDVLSGNSATFYGVEISADDPTRFLTLAAAGLVLVAVAYGICSFAQMIASSRLGRTFVLELRNALVRRATLLSLDQHHRIGSADLLDRVLSDAATMRRFIERVFIQLLTNVVRVGYPVVMLFIIDPLLSLAALGVLVPQWLASWLLQRKLHAATHESRSSQADLATVVQENFDGIETLKTLGAEHHAIARVQDAAGQLENKQYQTQRYTAMISGNVWFWTSVGIASVWWLGGTRVIAGEMTLGTLVMFAGLTAFVYQPFRQFTQIANTYRRGLASLERIIEVLDMPTSVSSGSGKPLKISAGELQFRNVHFAYDSTPVLSGVDLNIAPRSFTAIVGPSGSGKSSLARLAVRLYDPTQGQVCIDGQPIKSVSLDSLQSQVAVVPQHAVLFSGSLLDNVRLAHPDASEAEVIQACEEAGAWQFIEPFPNGLQTRVGRGGAQLSGGQLQRLAIARALLTRPRILLLDEPTSALDAGSEALLVGTLRRLSQQMTVVVIAHRVDTIAAADSIVLMDEGRVVAQGTHDQLLAESELYNELFGWEREDARPRLRVVV